ncbi:MAG TPA: hypothetical protein VIX82_10870 [Solirubrobacteraceae bacterium]
MQRIEVVDPTAFAVGGGAIWLTHFNTGSVDRVDPRTGHTTQAVSLTLPTPIVPGDRQFLPVNISAGGGSVWVSTARGWLAQIDSSSSRVVRMVRAPFDATGQVVVGSDAAWVAENSLGVGLVRPNGHRLQIRPIPDGRGRPLAVDQLEIGGGLVWTYGQTTDAGGPNGAPVLTNGAFITTLDERTGRSVHQLRFPVGPYGIAYGSGALFVADYDNGRLFRIDPGYRIHPLPRIRGTGILVTVTPGAIWATTKSGILRRIAVPTR